VDLLLENGARTQIANLDGATPLHAACAGGHEEVVNLLIQYGAFLNAGDDEDDTPLHWAVREGQREIINILISSGAEINCANSDGETPLGLAMALESDDIVEGLLGMGGKETGVPVNAVKGANNMKAVDVDVMDTEMKGLSIVSGKEHCDIDEKGFSKQVAGSRFVAPAFGTTPPSLSFVF